MILAPPRPRITVPGRCPVHPWRTAPRRARPRRHRSRVPLRNMAAGDILLDELGRRILNADGNLTLSNGTDDSVCCCGDGDEGEDCPNCPTTTPACVRVTVAGTTLCPCNDAYQTLGSLNGTYDLIQVPGTPCAWATATDATGNLYEETDCTGGLVVPAANYTIGLSYSGGTWFLSVGRVVIAFSSLLFTGSVAAANCVDPFVINNTYLVCSPGVYGSGGVDGINAYGGTATGTPYGC